MNRLWLNMAKRVGWVEFGSGQLGCGSRRVILSGLKTSSGQSGRVGSYFSHDFFFLFTFHLYVYKENNMFLPFGNSCNKLLDVKCITLNSPLISRMNSVKLINTYSIILKLYKS